MTKDVSEDFGISATSSITAGDSLSQISDILTLSLSLKLLPDFALATSNRSLNRNKWRSWQCTPYRRNYTIIILYNIFILYILLLLLFTLTNWTGVSIMNFLGLSFRILLGVEGGDSDRKDFDDRALLKAAVPVPPLFRINPFIFYKPEKKNISILIYIFLLLIKFNKL